MGVAMCVSKQLQLRCQHAISRPSSVGVNSHPALDEKPGIKFVWPYPAEQCAVWPKATERRESTGRDHVPPLM